MRTFFITFVIFLTFLNWFHGRKSYDIGYKQAVIDTVSRSYVNYDGSIYNFKTVYASSHCGICHYRWKGVLN